ncbi:MAG: hypothetical protein ACYDH1_01495 [Anaerolineaceae bacterium]
MKYYLSPTRHEFSEDLEIDVSKFGLYDETYKKLFELIYLEEKFDLFLESYFDFEVELLKIGSRLMIFNRDIHYSTHYDRNILNKYFSGLLSAASLYFDQSETHLIRIFGKSSTDLIDLKEQKKTLRENDSNFKFIHNLRNHSQHHDIPIESIKYSYSWTSPKEYGLLKYIVIPLVNISKLEKDTQFDKELLKIIKNQNHNRDLLDIRPFVRQYVEKLGNLHLSFRKEMKNKRDEWKQILFEVINKSNFRNENSTNDFAFLLSVNESKKIVGEKYFFKEINERITFFENKTIDFTNLHKRYVSNELE